jgi:hypothetical protein
MSRPLLKSSQDAVAKAVNLARFFADAEALLDATEAEVSEELAALGLDPEKAATEMDAIAREAKRKAGKLRLANAKEAVHGFRSKRPGTPQADRSVLTARLQRCGRRVLTRTTPA